MALLDNTGAVVVQYKYDAWGKYQINAIDPCATEIAILNPFRYRSYYYDTETNLYFLKTRYYDPEIGRFMTIDDLSYLDPETINGLNLYAYCGNNPVMNVDPSGHESKSFWKNLFGWFVMGALAIVTIAAVVLSGGTLLVPVLAGAAIGAGLNLGSQVVANISSGRGLFENINWKNVLLGGVTGAAFATGLWGIGGAIAIGGVSNAGMSAFEQKSWLNIVLSGVVGALAAGAGYALGSYLKKTLHTLDTSLGIFDYMEMTRADGASLLQGSLVALVSKMYTIFPNLSTGITRGILKTIFNQGGKEIR